MGADQGLAVVAALPILLLLLAHAPSAHDLDGSVYCSRDGETRRLSGFGAVAPVWSPDGETICYVQHTHDENLFHFISPAGELLQTVPLPAPLTVAADLTWHPDGEVTFAASQGESYDIYKLDSEGQAQLIMSDGIQPAWSPDGQSMAFTTSTSQIGRVSQYLFFGCWDTRLFSVSIIGGHFPWN